VGSGAKHQPISILVYSEREKTHLTAIIIWIFVLLKFVKLLIKIPQSVHGAFAFVATVDRDRRPCSCVCMGILIDILLLTIVNITYNILIFVCSCLPVFFVFFFSV